MFGLKLQSLITSTLLVFGLGSFATAKEVDEMMLANSAVIDGMRGTLRVCEFDDSSVNYVSRSFSELGYLILYTKTDPKMQYARTMVMEMKGFKEGHVLVYICNESGVAWFSKVFQKMGVTDIQDAGGRVKSDFARCLRGK